MTACMSWTDFMRERRIRRLLQRLSRQRIAMVLRPGGVWVVEKAVEDGRDAEADLNTCDMRGWIEPLANAVPTGTLVSPTDMPSMSGHTTIWKLNDSGWYVINVSGASTPLCMTSLRFASARFDVTRSVGFLS